MRYGLPYMGSKNKIAEWVISVLPSARHFYDLFCGGCAVTHAAMLSGRYEDFYINDIQGDIPQLFLDAVRGNLPEDYLAPIDREQFYARKNEPLVKLCWSFGNNVEKGYLWGEEIEKQKLEAFKMLVSDSVEKRYSHYRNFVKMILQTNDVYAKSESISRIHSVEHLQSLQALQALQSLQALLHVSSVVYADPPYRGTEAYHADGFDFDRFDNWLRNTPFPVYVSEYTMPSDFVCIAETERIATLCATDNSKRTIEKIFVHKRFQPKHQPKQMEFDF